MGAVTRGLDPFDDSIEPGTKAADGVVKREAAGSVGTRDQAANLELTGAGEMGLDVVDMGVEVIDEHEFSCHGIL